VLRKSNTATAGARIPAAVREAVPAAPPCALRKAMHPRLPGDRELASIGRYEVDALVVQQAQLSRDVSIASSPLNANLGRRLSFAIVPILMVPACSSSICNRGATGRKQDILKHCLSPGSSAIRRQTMGPGQAGSEAELTVSASDRARSEARKATWRSRW